jgi:ribosome-associated toxin RatA of RatAB toxin-antitoxin module
MPDVEVTETVKAPPQQLYDLVSDLPRMGEWSPENTGGKWLGRATSAAVGAKFRGTNRNGLAVWMTSVTVTAADAGRRFAFDVDVFGVPISTWAYTFADSGDGCDVTESWTDRRPRWMRVSSIATGVRDRNRHNRRNMQETLSKLKAAAEA